MPMAGVVALPMAGVVELSTGPADADQWDRARERRPNRQIVEALFMIPHRPEPYLITNESRRASGG